MPGRSRHDSVRMNSCACAMGRGIVRSGPRSAGERLANAATWPLRRQLGQAARVVKAAGAVEPRRAVERATLPLSHSTRRWVERRRVLRGSSSRTRPPAARRKSRRDVHQPRVVADTPRADQAISAIASASTCPADPDDAWRVLRDPGAQRGLLAEPSSSTAGRPRRCSRRATRGVVRRRPALCRAVLGARARRPRPARRDDPTGRRRR